MNDNIVIVVYEQVTAVIVYGRLMYSEVYDDTVPVIPCDFLQCIKDIMALAYREDCENKFEKLLNLGSLVQQGEEMRENEETMSVWR